MKSVIEDQSSVWVHALLSVAWADGHLDSAEQNLISDLFKGDSQIDFQDSFASVSVDSLQRYFLNISERENFLKTAVMVALADGIYSSQEDQLLRQFCEALSIDLPVLEQLRTTLDGKVHSPDKGAPQSPKKALESVRVWLDSVEIDDPGVAHFLCKLIPADCPFERDVVLFGKKLVHIPPMCKINPLYEQLVGLRFRSLSFLADECQEDITQYL